MLLLSKACCCCFKHDQIKSEPPVEEITSNKKGDSKETNLKDTFPQKKTISSDKENSNNPSNLSNINGHEEVTEISNVTLEQSTNQKNNANLIKNSETAAITNMMLDDIVEDDLEIAPIIHSESEIKVDLNAVEEASIEDICDFTTKEKDNDKKANNTDETSSRVIKMLKNEDKLDFISQSEDSDEVEEDDEDEEGIEVEIKETTPVNKPSNIITYEDSLVSNKNSIQKSAMYGDDSESDSDDSDDDSSDYDDDSETIGESKENITTISLSKVEEKKNTTVKREGSTITAVPAVIQQELTDDEMSEKII